MPRACRGDDGFVDGFVGFAVELLRQFEVVAFDGGSAEDVSDFWG